MKTDFTTAPAKTTIADIEVVLAEGEFQAVVTFFTEFQTQANIEECVIDAALAVLENAPLDKVADRFLNHRDQKFRLSYLLGGWRKTDINDESDEISFDEDEKTEIITEEGDISDADRSANRQVIEIYLDRIEKLTPTKRWQERIAKHCNNLLRSLSTHILHATKLFTTWFRIFWTPFEFALTLSKQEILSVGLQDGQIAGCTSLRTE